MDTIKWFMQIAEIPRPSGYEEKIASFLISIAKKRGYNYRTDDVGNVCIDIPAKGEGIGKPTLVLQSHMDMVCEKESSVEHDFLKNAIPVYEDQGFLKAHGTTLGADNGIGMALALSTLDFSENPALQLLFTVDEEVLFLGARSLRKGFFTGNYLINLDSGKDDFITIGSAGSMKVEYILPIERDSQYCRQFTTQLSINGLQGGHSGIDINKGRVSAIWFSVRYLEILRKNNINFRLISLDSGQTLNAISRFSQIHMAYASHNDLVKAQKLLQQFACEGFTEWPVLTFENNNTSKIGVPWDKKSHDTFISVSSELPHGPLAFLEDKKKSVQTSSNFAKIKEKDVNLYCFSLLCRSFEDSALRKIAKDMKDLGQKYDVKCIAEDPDLVWSPKKKNILLNIAKECYMKLFNSQVKFGQIHAGLECAYFEKVNPDLCIISIGPNIDKQHSPSENLDIASTKRMENFLRSIIKKFTEYPWSDE